MKLTVMTCFLFALLSFNVSAKVKEVDLKISGTFENLDESVLKLKSGTVSLFDSKNCGFFKCHSRNFILRNHEEALSVSLNKEGINSYYEYNLSSFANDRDYSYFNDFSLTSLDNQLKFNFVKVIKESSEEFKYVVVPESCEDICVSRETYCQYGEETDGQCRMGTLVHSCGEYQKECTPSYEACYREVTGKGSFKIEFINIPTNKVVGQFTSKEVPYHSQDQVPMPKCFNR